MLGPGCELDTDLLIVGAGTAGLATAIFARLAGYRCLVIESRIGVQDKACGEGLFPFTKTLLEELGVNPQPAISFCGIRYIANGQLAEGLFAKGREGLGVRRTVLNAALINRALSLGVRFHHAKVSEFADLGSHVEVCGFKGQWLIACDGLRSNIRKSLGMNCSPRLPYRFGMRQHFRCVDWPPFVEVHWYDDFEVYVTPVARDTVNVAILFSKSMRYEDCLAQAKEVNCRLGEPLTKLQGAGPFGRWTRTQQLGRVFLVGDAAGFLDPLTGEGNHIGLLSARELVGCLVQQRPQDYSKRWRKLVRGYWLVTTLLLWLGRNAKLRRLIVPVASRAPILFRWAFAALDRVPYRPKPPF